MQQQMQNGEGTRTKCTVAAAAAAVEGEHNTRQSKKRSNQFKFLKKLEKVTEYCYYYFIRESGGGFRFRIVVQTCA